MAKYETKGIWTLIEFRPGLEGKEPTVVLEKLTQPVGSGPRTFCTEARVPDAELFDQIRFELHAGDQVQATLVAEFRTGKLPMSVTALSKAA